jgi:GNAT superfamily N-acetyltransferase
VKLRLLTPADAPALEAFLSGHRDTSMFLRANLRRAGLVYEGKPFQGTYLAAFEQERLLGVAAHSWNGMVLVQSPVHLDEVVRACVDTSGRAVTGITGPLDQVHRARHVLALTAAPVAMQSDEWLYGLELSRLLAPPDSAETIVCRRPRPGERDTLVAWRLAYEIETLGASDTERVRQGAAVFLDAQIASDNAWVVVANDRIVSLAAFNAALPDIVQLGGIYTPPEVRGRNYAKLGVAAALRAAQERGASRAVLFTKNPSAVRSYEALGFERLGEYGLLLLR